MQRLAETFHGKLRSQRFRSQLLNRAGVECEPSKITRILEHETIPAQVQNDGCMFWPRHSRRQQIHPPSHTEVANQEQRFVLIRVPQRKQQVLPPPRQSLESSPFQRPFEPDRKSTRLNSSHIPLSRMPS